jgi:hypothetical protein
MSKRRHRRERGKNRHDMATQAPTTAPPRAAITAPILPTPATAPLGRRLTLADAFGTTFWVLALVAGLAGVACWHLAGPQAFRDSFSSDLELLAFLAPRFGAAMLIAAFAQVLLPRDKVAKYVGETAGLKALAIGTVAGGLTPGGPMSSFPLVQSLQQAGTGRSALIAYVTSWSTMGFQRILNWELPLLGPDMTLLRIASSLPLPMIAGLISRLLPAAPPATPDGERSGDR